MIRLLTLTYPLTAVTEAACGGTEQVAFQVLRGLASNREDITVTWIGAEGSASMLPCLSWSELLSRYDLATPQPREYTPDRLADLQRRCNQAVARLAAEQPFDLIHDQGAWVPRIAASLPAPVLFTVHLARSLYPDDLFETSPASLHVQCVSQTQWRQYGPRACCGVVGNGIDLERFTPRRHPPSSDAPLLFLGRICAEKGCHLAIAIARRARRRLWLVGDVAPFPSHRGYFEREIAPHLNAAIRWMPAPTAVVKQQLLREAGAVVIPSLIDETSSLVAMEAAACGVPVLALRAGALPEIVAHGVTGYVAGNGEALALAIARGRLGSLSPAACRARAERLFCARRMAAAYRALYHRLASPAQPAPRSRLRLQSERV
jgi:glycosyltransferase involved in cell wall biosynthesis